MVLNFLVVIRYIAKTLYGEDEDDVTPPNNNSVEEPKLLGLHPVSNEKVELTAEILISIWSWLLYWVLSYIFKKYMILLIKSFFFFFRFFWRVVPMGFMCSLVRTGKGTCPKEPLLPRYEEMILRFIFFFSRLRPNHCCKSLMSLGT